MMPAAVAGQSDWSVSNPEPTLSYSLLARVFLLLKRGNTRRLTTDDLMNKFTIVFQECEEGGFSAYVKEFPGAISEGETALEAANNVFDALVQLLAAQAEEQLKNLDEAPPHELELAFS